MIRNVLANLFSNAVKYSHRGGEVQISTEKQQNLVIVRISDKGTGMSEGELLQHSGNNLSKGQRGTENEKGSGLGLSLAKSFLSFHDSQLQLESTPGEGTTASFSLQCKAH